MTQRTPRQGEAGSTAAGADARGTVAASAGAAGSGAPVGGAEADGAASRGAPGPAARPPLAATAAQTTAENPWPLRQLSVKVGEYIARMSPLWVEGEIVQLNRRPGAGLSFMTLRDIDVDMSFSVPVREHVLRALPVEPVPGARVDRKSVV